MGPLIVVPVVIGTKNDTGMRRCSTTPRPRSALAMMFAVYCPGAMLPAVTLRLTSNPPVGDFGAAVADFGNENQLAGAAWMPCASGPLCTLNVTFAFFASLGPPRRMKCCDRDSPGATSCNDQLGCHAFVVSSPSASLTRGV